MRLGPTGSRSRSLDAPSSRAALRLPRLLLGLPVLTLGVFWARRLTTCRPRPLPSRLGHVGSTTFEAEGVGRDGGGVSCRDHHRCGEDVDYARRTRHGRVMHLSRNRGSEPRVGFRRSPGW